MLGILIIFSLFFVTFCVPALLVVWVIIRLRRQFPTALVVQQTAHGPSKLEVAGSSSATSNRKAG
jgi:hypothetical protein